MTKMLLKNARLLLPDGNIAIGELLIAGGLIKAVGAIRDAAQAAAIDCGGKLLTPGLIDLHTHGIKKYSYDAGLAAIQAGAACLPQYATTTFFPTLLPRLDSLDSLCRAADALTNDCGADMPGLHLEGPFTALGGAGCAVVPGDLGLLAEIIAACKGRLAIMSLSPETPGIIPIVERLVDAGVAPFITHTRASVAETQAAIAAGARHATHFYDVFPVPQERDIGVRPAGVVEAFLADPAATVDCIADGCHVDPVVIQMAVQAKGCDGVALVTDSNIGAGLPPGEYSTPWGYPVKIGNGGARVADPAHKLFGALAGSALTMDIGMANLLRWLRQPQAEIWRMGTTTPASIANLKDRGRLAPGLRADLALWDNDLTPAKVWVGGKVKYEKGE